MDASTLHPECTLGRQTPVCRQLGHEAAFRADQGLRTRHGHRRLGNVVLSASLSGGRQWPTTVCCGHLSQMDTPLRLEFTVCHGMAPLITDLLSVTTPHPIITDTLSQLISHEAVKRPSPGLVSDSIHRGPSVLSYPEVMSEAEKAESPRPGIGEEDAETLAAIQRGRDDSTAGRMQPLEDVRKRLPQWISASSSPKKR